MLPGYVRRFVVTSAPLLDLAIEGDLDSFFALKPAKPHALDPLLPVLETYPTDRRGRLTVNKPKDTDSCVFLYPGEPLFDQLRRHVCARFGEAALQGGVFVWLRVSGRRAYGSKGQAK